MPAYNSNVPQANQTVASTQSPIQTNFASIQQTLVINHEDFNSPNFGKHKFLQMPEQMAAPVTGGNEGAVYTKEGPLSAVTELFFRRESNGVEIPMTERGSGWTYLPSGLLVKWGSSTQTGYNQVVLFPTGAGIPAFSTVLFIMVSPRANADNQLNYDRTAVLSANSGSATQFFVNCFQLSNGNAVSSPFVWFAIGT